MQACCSRSISSSHSNHSIIGTRSSGSSGIGRRAAPTASRWRRRRSGASVRTMATRPAADDGTTTSASAAPTTPYILGLTGSIGMGKTTVSGMLAARGVPIVDADAIVHALYAEGGAAVAPVGAAFPSAVVGGAVSRPDLGRAVVGDAEAMARLEAIVHPLVEAARAAQVAEAAAKGAALVVLDIPLLFETGGEASCDGVAVVSAPPDVQRDRVLARPGMTAEKFEAILARQVPDGEKRRRADFVIDTGCGLGETEGAVEALVGRLLAKGGGGPSGAYARATSAQSAAAAAARDPKGRANGLDS